jgi:hypothetical protein
MSLEAMNANSAINTLLEISSESTSMESLHDRIVPRALDILYRKNGFFAFEAALEVFPLGKSRKSYSIFEWNYNATWKDHYKGMSPTGLCFAQDLFGTQFIVEDNAVYSFDPETAERNYIARSVEEWAMQILSDYQFLTGQPLAHDWQAENGALPNRSRLVPITPFVLGGPYKTENLVAMDAVSAMQLRASLALQIKSLPDGAEVIYEVKRLQ